MPSFFCFVQRLLKIAVDHLINLLTFLGEGMLVDVFSVEFVAQPPRAIAYLSGIPRAIMTEAFKCLKHTKR